MEEQNDKSFLGTGWGFPPTFNEQTLRLELVSEEEDIRQSLFLLISTTPGERILNPGYGCDLQSLVFERITESIRNKITSMVSLAILRFEPRIIVHQIDTRVVSYDPGTIHILVEYTVIQTNTRSNIVYPFYFQEGTHLKQ